MDDQIRQRFVRRVVRLAYYRRWLAALGLGLTVFGWVALADAYGCRAIWDPARRIYRVVCG